MVPIISRPWRQPTGLFTEICCPQAALIPFAAFPCYGGPDRCINPGVELKRWQKAKRDLLMNAINPEAKRYLNELYRRTEGNTGAQVSMFDVGAAMGLEKEAARKLAEDLIAEGWIEIRTLSGGIGITTEGIDMAQPAGGSGAGGNLSLGDGPLLEDKSRPALERILTEIKKSVTSSPAPYARLEEVVIDIKTIDIHLLSPRPKTAVIKAVLQSLKDSLLSTGASGLAKQVETLIGK
jgi:hypothetical protein